MNVRQRLFLPAMTLVLLGAGCGAATPAAPIVPPVPNASETASSTPEATAPAPAPKPVKTTTTAPAPAPKPVAVAPKPSTAPAPAPGERATGVKFVTDAMMLSVLVNDKGSELRWTMWSDRDFKGYVLVKSTTDANPYYPKQYYFRFENSAVNARYYADTQMERGKTTYYRVCALDADDSITCGPVASAKRQ